MTQAGKHPEMPSRHSRVSGFSLVEALVVVMVILVIAAIAIPSFVQARMKANEASAVNSMHTIDVAEVMYSQNYPEIGFAKTLQDMGTRGTNCQSPTPTSACLIMDDSLANGFKSGYVFQLNGDGLKPSVGYNLTGAPEMGGISGRCSFGSNQSGEIKIIATGSSGSSQFSLGSSGTCDH
jgi:type II secretory pathway pseudopilin PulG